MDKEYCDLRQKINVARRFLNLAESSAEEGFYDVAWNYLLSVSVLTDQYHAIYVKEPAEASSKARYNKDGDHVRPKVD